MARMLLRLSNRHAPRACALAGALLLAGCASTPSTVPAPTTPGLPRAPGASAATSQATAAPPAPGRAASAQADDRSPAFAAWLSQFRQQALAAGIQESTLRAALDPARYLPAVVERDRSQPEFTRSVWDYLDTAVSPQRVTRGQTKRQEAAAAADAAAARYGVPAEVLVAVWGMESNFGSNYGDIATIDALATLGFDGRRADWARQQLIAALRIVQNGDIDAAHMIGSWAGAMGQTQFLPTNFLAYAVDADGDGRRDIWGSMADVMASTGNFLMREGWQRGQTWGAEVRLPAGFDLARADPSVRQSSAQWAAEGVSAATGGPLPELSDAYLLLPAGARGPAFLVGPNFRALLRYNNATSYALGVGLLAQRIAGGPGVIAEWPRDLPPLGRSDMLALQQALAARGFDPGTPDGLLGPATRGAIRAWQRSSGQPADGYPTQQMLQQLRRH